VLVVVVKCSLVALVASVDIPTMVLSAGIEELCGAGSENESVVVSILEFPYDA